MLIVLGSITFFSSSKLSFVINKGPRILITHNTSEITIYTLTLKKLKLVGTCDRTNKIANLSLYSV